jgi:hypothetical protein
MSAASRLNIKVTGLAVSLEPNPGGSLHEHSDPPGVSYLPEAPRSAAQG